jgi:hypothetical protein
MTISRRNTIDALFLPVFPGRKRFRKAQVAGYLESAAIGGHESLRSKRPLNMRLRWQAMLIALTCVWPMPVMAQPTFLGAYRYWSAFMRQVGSEKVCYALSEPKTKEPAHVKRDPAYFLVNDWPRRRSSGEAEIVPGYRYRDGSTVTANIGSDKFDFFTKNEGDVGGAWLVNPADEKRLLRAMRNGAIAVVTGTSRRGTVTKDVYDLTGVGGALDRIHKACGM